MKSPAQISTQYADIKALLDQCLQHGGGTYTAQTKGAAVHFRHRAYTFRKLYREAISPSASPYDRLTIRKPANEVVKIDVIKLDGTFIPDQGEAVNLAPTLTPPPAIVEDNDPLLAEALALRERLNLE